MLYNEKTGSYIKFKNIEVVYFAHFQPLINYGIIQADS
jgi:hypothetical protein